jgi:hypothetical protein
MSAQHTPGPWIVEAIGATELEVAHEETLLTICKMPWVGSHYSGKPVEANAHLIAAAPELLEACQAMIEWDAREQDHAVDFYARLDLCKLAFDKARAAIAKAEGRS